MFGEPLLAHPAEIGGVHATWHPHSRHDHDGDQHDDGGEDEQHRAMAMLPRLPAPVCALVHKLSVRLCARRRTESATAFEFIVTTAQVRDVRAFMGKLLEVLLR